MKMPLPQHWRDFLIKVGQSVGVSFTAATAPAPAGKLSTSKRDKKRMRKEKFAEEVEDVFDLPLDLQGSLPDLFWQGSMVN